MPPKDPVIHNIIWDLSGTLFRPTSWGLSEQQVADLSLVFYMWSGKNKLSKLDAYALQLLNLAEEPLPYYQVIRLHTGDPVPAVVCSLLAGLIDSQEAYHKVMVAAEKADHNSLSPEEVSPEELIQVYRMLKAFFDPSSLTLCMQPIEEHEKLVARCSQNPDNTLFVLSNWDRESFDQFFKTRSAYNGLTHFKRENIMISADVGYIKPQPEIFESFLSKHKLDPKTCFFIDDQEENIAGAQTFGIRGMQCKINKGNKLLHTLEDLHII